MNRTKIEWADWTWNPVTGCWGPGGTLEKPNRCSYCYAHKIANRFHPCNYKGDDPFAPTFHPDRLSEPAKVKKPSRIFVCSMSDLFGDWVFAQWIMRVRDIAAIVARHHTYIFLTKNPKRYQDFNSWPDNCWLGTTITNQADADKRIPELLKADARVRFVSCEPLLSKIDLRRPGTGDLSAATATRRECPGMETQTGQQGALSWIICGAMTGPGSQKHQPKPWWVQSLIDQCRGAGVPLFLKDNLHWPEKIQEWPE